MHMVTYAALDSGDYQRRVVAYARAVIAINAVHGTDNATQKPPDYGIDNMQLASLFV